MPFSFCTLQLRKLPRRIFQPELLISWGNQDLYHLTDYLGKEYDLAKNFNSFYQACPIGKLEDAELKASRLALVSAVKTAIKEGLALLGIPAPNRM